MRRTGGKSGGLRAHAARWAALLAALLPGCAGYQIGNDTLYPSHIRTVHVPIFESVSFRRGLAERVTEAVAKEIERRTPYKVADEGTADTVLYGRIIGESKRAVVYDRYDQPRELEVNLRVQIRWVDRNANLVQPGSYVAVPPELVTISETASLAPELGQSVASSQQKAIDKLAQQIVSVMETPW